jgi:mono/diheme cytochrome c family protein
VLLALALAVATVTFAAGCGGDETSTTTGTTTAATTTVATTTEPMETETEPMETETEPMETEPSADGEAVFASAGCGTCHIFEDAGATATIGPDLDASTKTVAEVEEQVRNGSGAMPAFEGQLSPDEISAVAEYVVDERG